MTSLLITNGHLVTLDDDNRFIENGSIYIEDRHIADIGAFIMILFGVVLLVPQVSERFATATAGFSARADAQIDSIDNNGLTGQFLTGLLLGAVWVPCIGPTLGGAISLAAQGQDLLRAAAIMTSFALGVSTIIILLGYGTREMVRRRQNLLRRFFLETTGAAPETVYTYGR